MLASVDAISTQPLIFSISSLQDSTQIFLSPSQIGLAMHGNSIAVTTISILNAINTIHFPLTGVITITDARAQCISGLNITTGPCSAVARFSLDILGAFDPACPNDVMETSYDGNPVAVEWTSPNIKSLNGTAYSLQTTYEPHARFALGVWKVMYQIRGQDLSQSLKSRVLCEFKVSIHITPRVVIVYLPFDDVCYVIAAA